MLRFYSNGKLFGYYIIVTWILMSVSDIANADGTIRGIFSESGEIIYSFHSESCVKLGNEIGIFVKRINLFTYNGVNVNIVDVWEETFNSDYTDLIEKVTIDCNGRDECNSSYNGLRIPRPTLDDVPVDFINIFFLCLPVGIDNITVFNIGLDLGSTIPKSGHWYSLVLRLENNKKTHRHCKIDGDRSDNLIVVRHVDFGLSPKCKKINSDLLHQCYANMTLVSRDNKECAYSWQPPFPYKYIECKAEDVDIDVHMSTGFVWLSLTAYSDIILNCSGSNSYNDETSYRPTTPDSGKFDYIYTIIIPASVAFLALLIAIVLIVFCVCRRRERKRNSNYEVPSKTQQDNHPYSVPCGASADVPHASHPTEYLEVIDFDDDYLQPTVVKNQEQEVMYEEIDI